MLTICRSFSNRDRMHAVRIAMGMAMLAAMLGGSGCGRRAVEGKVADAPAVTTVETSHPQRRTFHRLVEQPAWIEAFEEAPIYAKISGYVEKVNVEIGTRVRKDSVLAVLWVPEMVQELKQKNVLVAQARIEIDQSEKALRVAQAHFETTASLVLEARAAHRRSTAQFDRWKSELDRMEDLARAKVIDSQTRDETLHQFRASQASQEEAEAKVQTAIDMQHESEAKRDKADADLRAAKNNLELAQADERRVSALHDYAEIKAPFDGIVTERHVHTGHLLQPFSSGTAGSKEPLFVVVRVDRVRVFLNVPEADAVLVHEGVPATIRVPALNDREFVGKVAGTSWSLQPEQRTLCAEVDFDNADELLRPGTYAHATVEVENANTFSLPSAAVVVRDGQPFCFCVEDGKAVKTSIRVGAKVGPNVEVLKKLGRSSQPGDKGSWQDFTGHEAVILSGSADLTDGQLIQAHPDGKG